MLKIKVNSEAELTAFYLINVILKPVDATKGNARLSLAHRSASIQRHKYPYLRNLTAKNFLVLSL